MKNDKPVSFSDLSLDFSSFHFFKKIHISNFLKSNRLIFDEPIKPVRPLTLGGREEPSHQILTP
jgi:hypothetical protein